MLKTVYVLLSDVAEADLNARDHSDGDPDLVGSIGRFGYLQPILRDDRTGKLIDGHGRLYRLRDLERSGGQAPENVQVTAKGWKIPVITGWASETDEEAEAAAIALQPKDGRYNEDALYRVLHRQQDLTGLGFGDNDVQDLGRRLGVLARENTDFLREFTDKIPSIDPTDPGPTDPLTETEPGTTGTTPTPTPTPGTGPAPTPAPDLDGALDDKAAVAGIAKIVDDRVVLQIPMTSDQRRTIVGLLNHAKERAGLDSHAAALTWALERSPASPSLPEDGARRAADTVRHALKALADGDHDRATTIMGSLVGAP